MVEFELGFECKAGGREEEKRHLKLKEQQMEKCREIKVPLKMELW